MVAYVFPSFSLQTSFKNIFPIFLEMWGALHAKTFSLDTVLISETFTSFLWKYFGALAIDTLLKWPCQQEYTFMLWYTCSGYQNPEKNPLEKNMLLMLLMTTLSQVFWHVLLSPKSNFQLSYSYHLTFNYSFNVKFDLQIHIKFWIEHFFFNICIEYFFSI